MPPNASTDPAFLDPLCARVRNSRCARQQRQRCRAHAADDLTAAAWHDATQAKFFTYIHVINPLIKRMGERGADAVVYLASNRASYITGAVVAMDGAVTPIVV